ncbi:MAG: hypothetical protein M3Z92_10325 [Bacteroidota bacterium]|nr:hypothetical protein [Bacteroidota bacterium]
MNNTNWLQKQEHFEWMQKCLNCWKATEEFISKSIQDGENLKLINTCRDVAEMCSQCIKFEAQRSPFFQQLCQVCADMCETCVRKLAECDPKSEICDYTIEACTTLAIASREVSQKRKMDPVNTPT